MARSDIPVPKYKLNTEFQHIDTEETYILTEVRFDTYILMDTDGNFKGESLMTLEYDYEVLNGNT